MSITAMPEQAMDPTSMHSAERSRIAGRPRPFQFGPLGVCGDGFAAKMGAAFEGGPDSSLQPAQVDGPPAADATAAAPEPGHTCTPRETAPQPGAVQPSDVAALARDV